MSFAEPSRAALVWTAVAFAGYAAIYLARLSFVIDGSRYFTLADDQMISMRYADNLAHGYGLVWNPGGARIEGYTNFLWVVYMAIFHWLAIPRRIISVCIQLSGAAFLLANLVYVRAIARRMFDERSAILALALVAFYVPLDNWAFQGTEVGILTLFVTCGAWWALRAFDSDANPWRLWLLLGVTTLIRPDMVVFCGVTIVGVALARREPALRRFVSGAAVVGAFVAAETVFRIWYFGDPLPNTYYLKVTGFPLLPKLARGAVVMLFFFAQILPALAAMLADPRLRRPSRDVRFLLAVFAAQTAYSVSVGGDTWEGWGGSNRFVAIAVPLFLVVAAPPLVTAWTRLCAAVEHDLPRLTVTRGPLAAAAAAATLVVALNLLALSFGVGLHAGFRRLTLLDKPYETDSDEREVRAAVALRDVTSRDAVVAVIWAGAIPYFSERPAIDMLGKMDRRIAHEPMHVPDAGLWTAFYPGHMKWDYEYSIAELKPDVVQRPLWAPPGGRLPPTPYLDRDYERLAYVGSWYVRRGSPRVNWNATARR